MVKSNFNVWQGETIQDKCKHHNYIKPKVLREFKSICGKALILRLNDIKLTNRFIKKKKGEIWY